ncbi:MAG TPA: hypothetical protein VGC97_03710 [Pyrinomonadaceae bacterium]|jgi:hypothetical protein
MMIKDFGARVESVWEGLRPLTKKMLVGVLQAKTENPVNTPTQKFSYDTQSDWELSRLLSALDDQAKNAEVAESPEKSGELQKLTETCISVMKAQSESAEVFIQLAERALAKRDYKEIDRLADLLAERFSVGEMCEIARQTSNAAIRAIAMETIALMPVEEIVPSLDDPIYEDIARAALEMKAFEYESEDARRVLDHFVFDEIIDD